MSRLHVILLCMAVSIGSIVATVGVMHVLSPAQTPVPSAASMTPSNDAVEPPSTSPLESPPALAPVIAPVATTSAVACKSDIEKFCAAEKNQAKTEHCLQQHYDDASSTCHVHLTITRDNLAPCNDDIGTYCATAGYGGGTMEKCLLEHKSTLSAACTNKLKVKLH